MKKDCIDKIISTYQNIDKQKLFELRITAMFICSYNSEIEISNVDIETPDFELKFRGQLMSLELTQLDYNEINKDESAWRKLLDKILKQLNEDDDFVSKYKGNYIIEFNTNQKIKNQEEKIIGEMKSIIKGESSNKRFIKKILIEDNNSSNQEGINIKWSNFYVVDNSFEAKKKRREAVVESICKKNEIIKNYKNKYDQKWLLIHNSKNSQVKDDIEEHYKSYDAFIENNFNRIFLFDINSQEIFEINKSNPKK